MKLIKYVTDCKRKGKRSKLKALLLFSVIWNAQETDAAIHKPLTRYTLNRFLCNQFKKVLKRSVHTKNKTTVNPTWCVYRLLVFQKPKSI